MRTICYTFLLAIIFHLVASHQSYAQHFPFQDTTLPVSQRVEDLIGRLTLDEKLAFLEHQNPAVERLGIKPYSWWNEALHGIARNGIATVYPMPIALAASFDPEMVNDVYSYIADEGVRKYRESQAAGEYGDNTGITFFTPNINIFRDPRWGRGMETFGEDPFLTAHMGLAAVQGLQGIGGLRTKAGPNWVIPDSKMMNTPYLVAAACIKHLAVHSGPEGLRHQFDARISNRDLWTTYLPAFEYIIKNSDVQQVMCAYNRLNGEPCCTNQHLLVDILRNKWHYNGILVTDCWALNDCWEPDTVIPRHRTHATAALAAAAAFGSEVDLECGSGLPALKTAIDSGYINEKQVDEHLRRVLTTRFRIRPEWFSETNHGIEGLYKNPHRVSSQTLVMLKNNGILPLKDIREMKKMAIVGPNAFDSAMALGNYNGTPPYCITIAQAFEKERTNTLEVLSETNQEPVCSELYFDTACHLATDDYLLPADFWPNVKKSDVIIFCGGLSPALEGEELPVEMPGFHKGDRTAIELPRPQRDMIKELKLRTGKPIVLVLCTGSAIALENVIDDVDAVIVAWYGGQEMGIAVTNALIGYTNDFGRLPVTFYRSTSQLPDFADYNMQHRTYRYMDDSEPLFPFGHGLNYSYSHFDSVSFDRDKMTLQGVLVLDSIDKRCSYPGGKEVIQVYLSDPQYKNGPKQRLVAINSLFLTNRDNKSKRAHFSIPIDNYWLSRYNADTDQMELPPSGTPLKLKIKDGPEIDFVY